MTAQKTTEKRFSSISSIVTQQVTINQSFKWAKEESDFLEALKANEKSLIFQDKYKNNGQLFDVIKMAEDKKETKILTKYLNSQFPKKVVDGVNLLPLCFQVMVRRPFTKEALSEIVELATK